MSVQLGDLEIAIKQAVSQEELMAIETRLDQAMTAANQELLRLGSTVADTHEDDSVRIQAIKDTHHAQINAARIVAMRYDLTVKLRILLRS